VRLHISAKLIFTDAPFVFSYLISVRTHRISVKTESGPTFY